MSVNKNLLYLHGVIFLWGFTGILGKLISIDSDAIVWWRMFIASASLGLYMILRGKSFQTSWNNRAKYLFTGVVTALHWICFFEALKVSNVSVTLCTLSSTSFFVAFLEPLLFKRKIMGYEIILSLFTIAGIIIIFNAEADFSWGITLALLSAMLAAVFSTLNGVFVKNDRPTLITFYEMIGGVLAITVYVYFADSSALVSSFPTAVDWAYLLILGIVCTAFAFVVSVEVLRELSPFTVSISINMEPIYAIIFALLIFKEDELMSGGFYLGALVVFATIFANSWLKKRKSKLELPHSKLHG